ncbi:TFIIB-type zinc ribbon-containing protein, partial [Streptococcus agalactiae]|nr:TFIIB-type zinc ribbon-containing protein [Streptococcus agalactiae]
MDNDIKFEISVPSDEEGYVLLKCPSCGEKFMLTVEDIEDESTVDIWCPNCGLTHDHYLDDDIYELAERIVENQVAEMLNDFSNSLEKKFRNSKNIKFEQGKEIKKEAELPIGRKTGDYEEKK